jgi:hypothetical protein
VAVYWVIKEQRYDPAAGQYRPAVLWVLDPDLRLHASPLPGYEAAAAASEAQLAQATGLGFTDEQFFEHLAASGHGYDADRSQAQAVIGASLADVLSSEEADFTSPLVPSDPYAPRVLWAEVGGIRKRIRNIS